jgi:hypothetical protein
MNRFPLSRLLPLLALLCLLAPSAKAQDVSQARPALTVSQRQAAAQWPRHATAQNGIAASARSNDTLTVKPSPGGEASQLVSASTGPAYGREFVVGAASTLAGVVGGAIGTLFGAPVLGAAIGAGIGGTIAAWLYDRLSD